MVDFELAKYQGKWSVYATKCRIFFFVGMGKKFCKRIVEELNNELDSNYGKDKRIC